jgi:cardiolipin synthase C
MLAAALLLPACSLSQKKVHEVDARVDARREMALVCPSERSDRCVPDSPLLDLGSAAIQGGRHYATLLEYGEQALQIRLHLIRAAREFIDLQSFILRKDETGELILEELLQAARRGVRVRLLVDQMFSFSDVEYLVALTMAHSNFEIRFYNPSFDKAEMARHDWITAVACCFHRFNQRMHNKLLVVDNLVGVVGGRNIADRYFDYDTNYDFKDRDVAVYGPSVAEMRASFEWFWSSPETVPVQYLRDVARELLDSPPAPPEPYVAPARLAPPLERAADVQYIREAFVDTALEVDQLEYFSDRPRKRDFPDGAPKKDITLELYEVLNSARHSVVIQSPYLVLSKRARQLFAELRRRNPTSNWCSRPTRWPPPTPTRSMATPTGTRPATSTSSASTCTNSNRFRSMRPISSRAGPC